MQIFVKRGNFLSKRKHIESRAKQTFLKFGGYLGIFQKCEGKKELFATKSRFGKKC